MRDGKTHKFINNKYSTPEFEYLASNTWEGTEKIDGTSCRIFWNHKTKKLAYGARTEQSQMPMALLEELRRIFEDNQFFKQLAADALFYGEGYGKGIGTNGAYYKADGAGFILFDVIINGWILSRNKIANIANQLGIEAVPVVFKGTLNEAIEFTKAGFNSSFGEFKAEGLVLRPQEELFARDGSRIITKIKYQDFK